MLLVLCTLHVLEAWRNLLLRKPDRGDTHGSKEVRHTASHENASSSLAQNVGKFFPDVGKITLMP